LAGDKIKKEKKDTSVGLDDEYAGHLKAQDIYYESNIKTDASMIYNLT